MLKPFTIAKSLIFNFINYCLLRNPEKKAALLRKGGLNYFTILAYILPESRANNDDDSNNDNDANNVNCNHDNFNTQSLIN